MEPAATDDGIALPGEAPLGADADGAAGAALGAGAGDMLDHGGVEAGAGMLVAFATGVVNTAVISVSQMGHFSVTTLKPLGTWFVGRGWPVFSQLSVIVYVLSARPVGHHSL